jgi:hypothetical protein
LFLQIKTVVDFLAIIPYRVRSDYGSETVDLYNVHKAFHMTSPEGDQDECYVYGRSVHNQRIECYWSGFIRQWGARWQQIFKDIEVSGHFLKNDQVDQMAMVYVFMPIIQAELEVHRRGYNAYPIRRNRHTNSPSGCPEDNYVLTDPAAEFSVKIDRAWIQRARQEYLSDFDATVMISPESRRMLDGLMQESPEGYNIDISNARRQYEYLRESLRALI